MSRAFTKEPDGEQAEAELPVRPQSKHPNYITKIGLEKQKEDLNKLLSECALLKETNKLDNKNKIKLLDSQIIYLKQRVESAIPIEINIQEKNDIRFGATIDLIDNNANKYRFSIVGQDEVDTNKGFISWVSPLGKALIGKQPGDIVTWTRPIGDIELEIISFYYS